MKTIRLVTHWSLGLLLVLTILSCGSDDNDPNPGGGGGGGGGNLGGGTGTISTTCTNSTSGTGTFVLNGVASVGPMVVTGVCPGSATNYTTTISDSTERDIVINFRGMPNSGTFNIKNLLDYTASNVVADCFVTIDNNGSTYSSRTVATKVTVTRTSSSLRLELPSITVDRLGGSGSSTITAQADFTVNL